MARQAIYLTGRSSSVRICGEEERTHGATGSVPTLGVASIGLSGASSVTSLIAWIVVIDRAILAVLFIYAAAAKLRNISSLNTTIASLISWLPQPAVAAAVIVLAELATGVLSAVGYMPVLTGVIALILAVVFITSAIYAQLSGLSIACSCFGPSSSILDGATAMRAVGLAALAAVYLLSGVLAARSLGPVANSEVVPAAVVIGTCMLIVLHLERERRNDSHMFAEPTAGRTSR